MGNRTIAEHAENPNPNGWHSRLRVERLASGQPGLIFEIEDFMGDKSVAISSVLIEDGNAFLRPILAWLDEGKRYKPNPEQRAMYVAGEIRAMEAGYPA